MSDKLNVTTFQGRLARALDRIQRRCNDNAIRLTGAPVDMLRISVKRDAKSQDIISRKIEDREIIPVVLPEMQDVPLRHFAVDQTGDIRVTGELTARSVKIPSMYPINDKAYYEVYIPMACQVDDDDLLIRLIWVPGDERPFVMCLQVKEVLATVGKSSVTQQKLKVTFYDEELPANAIDWILVEYNKRMRVNY